MAEVSTEAIRNVVLVGNSGTGKTQLSEAMLHKAGMTTRLGTPEEGSTTSDSSRRRSSAWRASSRLSSSCGGKAPT